MQGSCTSQAKTRWNGLLLGYSTDSLLGKRVVIFKTMSYIYSYSARIASIEATGANNDERSAEPTAAT
jgi:hypothetical protein